LLSPAEIQGRLEKILLTVQKPGRYVGGELNQVQKDWDGVEIHTALIFPDIYDLGQPNLGVSILYDILNRQPDILAERVYAPWLDMETAMRENGIPLYSLESKHALADFDILGFTLPYETLYTNVINLLDLAELPLRSSERSADHPLIIAGGHAAFNPEPMHAFIDAFVIGEGEEVILEVVQAYRAWKQSGSRVRDNLLHQLAAVPGVYVPTLYEVTYHPDGLIASISPHDGAPAHIIKRIVGKLPPPVTRFIVPNVEVVHNRVAVEIMRGCSRGCRFCHAGMINRPVRERPVDEIVNALEAALDATGYEEVALLSLSSSDYTHIVELVDTLNQRFSDRHLSLTLPSLRIETFSVDLMDRLKTARPSGGFTLAPEAATERMRSIINKVVSPEQLLEAARAVYSHGWTSLKLYFMIGHPEETLDDVQAIADLCHQVLAVGKSIIGGKARVHAGVSTFVPKAHTPFQWAACDQPDQIRAKQNLLRQSLRHPNIKLTWTEPADTLLEAWLARGDRRLAEVILAAWKNGARFDAWQDQFAYEKWQGAFAEVGLDPAFYSHRQRSLDEILPWSTIHSGVRIEYLKKEYQKSLRGEFTDDCRDNCFSCGILQSFKVERKGNRGDLWKCPEVGLPMKDEASIEAAA
jgi:radical SAM family uncharacterized protein